MRRILVGLKRVVDANVRIRVKTDGSGIDADGAKLGINPFDEIALEEALRMRERGDADEVVVASIGPEDVQQQLRNGLAMGADRAILVQCGDTLEPLGVARVLLALVQREAPMLVLRGKQGIDGDHNQTGQMLAALWDRPQATFASRIVLADGVAQVTREVDAGRETLEVDLPAVVTADLRLNEPRFVKLPDIMKAKRKPLETVPLAELDVDTRPRLRNLRHAPPPTRGRGVMVKDAAELVSALAARGVV